MSVNNSWKWWFIKLKGKGRQIFVNFRSCSAKFDQAAAKTTGQKETEKYRIFLKLMHYFT